MADKLNVDIVNIRDMTQFPSESDLSLLEFYSRKGSVNKKIDGIELANRVAFINDLLTFTGVTIPDNATTKEALQALETALENLNVGEANTGNNLGIGAGLFASKSGVNLNFKSVVAGTNMSITEGPNSITLNASGGGGGASVPVCYDAGSNVWVWASDIGVVATNPSAGTYTITIPEDVVVYSFHRDFTSTGQFTPGGEAIFNVAWTSVSFNTSRANAVYPEITLIDAGGNRRQVGDVSMTVTHTSVSGGSTSTIISNINGLGIPVSVQGQLI